MARRYASLHCCSTLQLTITMGVYTAMIYAAAFTMELIYILEGERLLNLGQSNEPLSPPGYVLMVIYFTFIVLSMNLLHMLYQKRSKYFLLWIYAFLILFMPEFALVVYMYVFHWGYENINGITELFFFFLRVPANVVCLMCVYRLHNRWRDNITTEKSLKKLSALQLMKNKSEKNLCCNNEGYLNSSTDSVSLHSLPLSTCTHRDSLSPNNSSNSKWFMNPTNNYNRNSNDLMRRHSMASQYRGYKYPSHFMRTHSNNLITNNLIETNVLPPISYDDHFTDEPCEFNASLYSGNVPFISHGKSEQALFSSLPYNSPDLDFVDSSFFRGHPYYSSLYYPYTYYNSRANYSNWLSDYRSSMRSALMQEQWAYNLDRRRAAKRSLSFSEGGRFVYKSPNQSMGLFGYPSSQNSKLSLGNESDDFRKYKDIAL